MMPVQFIKKIILKGKNLLIEAIKDIKCGDFNYIFQDEKKKQVTLKRLKNESRRLIGMSQQNQFFLELEH